MFKKILPFLIVIILTLPVVVPLLMPGFFKSDDGGWMVIRLSAFHQTLKTGQFPVRFLEPLNHGYGYPVTNFLYPLPFYMGEIIHLLGFSFINTVKLLFAFGFIFGAIFMYLWTRKWGQLPGIVSATIYTFFIYRITDVYQRGSLGESVAFMFVPLIFLFIDKKKIPLAALATAALIMSHNSLALMFLPIILLYGFFITKLNFKALGIMLALSLGVSAFFWIPALYDLQYTKAFETQVSDFQNYFLSDWLVILEIFVPLVVGFILLKKKLIFWGVITVGAVFLALPISNFLWEILPLPKLIQFPWRFLAIPTFTIAVVAGLIAQKNKYLGIGLLIIFLVIGVSVLRIDRTFEPDNYYYTNDDTTTVKNEYMPIWVKSNPTEKPPVEFQIVDGRMQINKVYFPGATVLVNGESVPINYSYNGFVQIEVPGSQDDVQFKYYEPPLHLIADTISVIAFIIVLFLCVNS